ncbi:MAG: YggT family protein [Patescibacteria group bacterium]|nr:YggT family protein [Patescibacteria group bacterium]
MDEKEVQSTTTTRKVIKEPAIKTGPPQAIYETKKSIFRTYQVVWYFLGVIEVLLGFRIILKIFGADPYSGFANLIYSLSSPFALPFFGVLRISTATTTGSLIEWSTLVGMAVYWIVAYGIVQLIQFVKPVTPDEVEQTVDSQ